MGDQDVVTISRSNLIHDSLALSPPPPRKGYGKAAIKYEKGPKKRTNPIMRNSKARDKNSQNNKLHQKLKNLEQEYWDTCKRVKPRSQILKCSTGVGSSRCFSEHSSVISSLHDQILENSPRSLISCLQESRRKSPMSDVQDEGLVWKVRNNDLAVQEILRERRAALASGKLKGRRLFEGSSSSEVEGEDICSECFDHLCHAESEVRSMGSYGSDDEDEKRCFEEYVWSYGGNDRRDSNSLDSSLSEEKMGKDVSLMEGEKEERDHDNKGKRRVVFGANLVGKDGGKWMLAMAWFAVLTMALALGLISMSCNGGNFEEKVYLIPT